MKEFFQKLVRISVKILKWLFIVLFILFALIFIVWKVPAVHSYALEKATTYFNEKTGGNLQIGEIDLRLPFYIQLEDILLEDPDNTKIASIGNIEIYPGWRHLFAQTIRVDDLIISDLKARMIKHKSGEWNFDFIIDGFSSEKEQTADTTQNSWGFSLGELELAEIDFTYADRTSGDSIHSKIGSLGLEMEELDLENNTFLVEDLNLSDNQLYFQFSSNTEEAGTTDDPVEESTLPNLGLNHLSISNTVVEMDMGEPSLFRFDVGELELSPRLVNIEKNKYHINRLAISATDVAIPISESPEESSGETTLFPELDVQLSELSVSNFNFKTVSQAEENDISLKDISLELIDLKAGEKGYAAEVKSLSGSYNQFDELKEFRGKLRLTPSEAEASELRIAYGKSEINLSAFLSYTQFEDFLENYEFQKADLDIPGIYLDKSDLKNFQNEFAPEELPEPRAGIRIAGKVKGNLSKINIQELAIRSGDSFVKLDAISTGDKTWPRDLFIDRFSIQLVDEDVFPYLTKLNLDSALVPPRTLLSLNGKYTSARTDVKGDLNTTFGDVNILAKGAGYSGKSQPMKLNLSSEQLSLGEYLKMPQELRLDFALEADVEDVRDSVLAACLKLEIDSVYYDRYNFSNILLNAELDSNNAIYTLSVKDTFLLAQLGGNVQFDDGLKTALNGDIYGIDLEGIGYSDVDIRGSLGIVGYFNQDSAGVEGHVRMDEILFVKQGERFPISPIEADYYQRDDSTVASVKSDFLELSSASNRSPDSLSLAIADMLARGNQDVLDSTAFWRAEIHTGNLTSIREIFLPDLTRFEPADISIDFDASEESIVTDVNVPGITYGKIVLDSLTVRSEGSDKDLSRRLHIEKLAYDTLAIEKLDFRFDRTTDGANLKLSINGEKAPNRYLISADLLATEQTLRNGFSINVKDSLILNGKQWNYDERCCLRFDDGGLQLDFVELSRNDQSIKLDKRGTDQPLRITAQNFKLSTFTQIVDTEEALIAGQVFGQIDLFPNGSFSGDGRIENLVVSGAPFGRLSWNASQNEGVFQAQIQNQGELVNFSVAGEIKPENENVSSLDLKVELSKLELSALENIVPAVFRKAAGSLQADISIQGTTQRPELNGSITIPNATLGLTGTFNNYEIQNETIKIEPKQIKLNNFSVIDSSGSKLSIDGSITHDIFDNPTADLEIKANDFTLLSVTKDANQPFYGKLVTDLDLRVEGDITAPLVQADIGISEKTNFSYYIVNTAEAEAFDEELLEWTNFDSQPEEAILLRDKVEERTAGDIFANNPKINGRLTVDKGAVFRVVIDSTAGDYLRIQGDANLGLNYDRAGNFRLNGNYKIEDGYYQMSFYDLIRKKFKFQKGSRLIWNGEPTNALVDITAIYETRAGIANLMLSEPGASFEESFQQQLPFKVLLKISGELMDPEISFGIELAEEARGALSGSVQARLNQLAENESNLNKQVFALLVLGSFLPQSGGGDNNVLANQARNSASQVLTNTLNNLSDKYISGVDINFDLYSYGGAAGKGNTDLNVNVAKSFLNDRVVVKVGGTVALENDASTPNQASQQQLNTNIEAEYKLTPDGRYRLIVFSKTDFEDIVIGRITRTGGGFTFQRDFDRFRYLFTPNKKEQGKKEEEENEEQENSREEKRPEGEPESK